MKFKVDENLPAEVASLLLEAGYDTETVFSEELVGAKDSTLANICLREARIFITLDTDYSDIRIYPPTEYPGIVVLRVSRQDKRYILDIITKTIKSFEAETPEGKLWIVEDNRIRIRE